MAERPILFSGPMVRAIIEGRKTQTRRVYKPTAGFPRVDGEVTPASSDQWTEWGPCPYGVTGDVLWVKETWGLHDTQPSDGPDRAHVYYRETDGDRHDLRYQLWRPSIHMPRWACRLTLLVEWVRAERLQNISEEGAKAEGCTGHRWAMGHGEIGEETPADEFERLWDRIHGKRYPWASNPWVWVVGFTREEDRRG